MRRWILAAGLATGTAVMTVPMTVAQTSATKDLKPGYMIIRVVLDTADGGGPPAGGQVDPNTGQPIAPANAPPRRIDPTKSVVAVVPYSSIEKKLFFPDKPPNAKSNPSSPTMKHKYGTTHLIADKTFIQVFPIRDTSLERQVRNAYTKWSTNRTFEPIYDICEEALKVGMVDEAFTYCNEMLKLPEARKDITPPARFERFAKAFRELSTKLDAAPGKSDNSEEWKNRLGGTSVAAGTHYSLIVWDQTDRKDVERKLKMLDQNFRAFYLWHALQGVSLPLPDKRLVAVQSDSTNRVNELRASLDGLPVQSDAFYSPSHNILVLAPERMDANGNAFFRLVQGKYTAGWNRDQLVLGKAAQLQAGQFTDTAQMMTLAITDQFLTEEAEHAAISREGCRQLYVASGLVPQNVVLPRWLDDGLSSLFQKPKGPLFVRTDGKTSMAVGLAAGYGAPNYIMHRQYKTLRDKFAVSPASTLRFVLMDMYYAAAAAGQDIDPKPQPVPGPNGQPPPPPPPPPTPDAEEDPNIMQRRRVEQLMTKANTASWALTYYLARSNRIGGLQKFLHEISRMPRDMQIDDDAVLMAFCRSYDMVVTVGPTPQINGPAFAQFASDWLQYMNNVPPYGVDVPLDSATLDPTGPGGGSTAPTVGGGGPGGGGRPGPGGGGGGGGGRPGPGVGGGG